MSLTGKEGTASLPPLAILTGPTGSGKSAVAVVVAERTGAEIVCADSRQVYRGFPVGSAQPGAQLTARVPHHLYGVLEPDMVCSAGTWREMATEIVAGIRDRGALPLLVGGTGLWISAFLNELPLVHPANPEMLERLEKRLASEGPESLWREMERVDPQSAGRIHRHDRYRILRALAFHETTGGPISAIRRKGSPLFSPVVHCALDLSRPELYDRINKRTEIMFAEGLVAEVATLRSRGLDPALPALKSIGYGTVCEMLDRKIDLARALAVVQQDTRRYAKRQLTWLRAQEGIIRVDARDPALAAERVTSEILRVIGPFPRPAP